MRQGGMKPKSHSSGTYWIRANAGGGKNKNDDPLDGDVNGDGVVDEKDFTIKLYARFFGMIIGVFLILLAVIVS
jgi:hypothetical protein